MTFYRLIRITTTTLAVVTIIAVGGCGLRIGSPPAPIPTADGHETQRQMVAIALERVTQAAKEDSSAEATELAEVAQTYLTDLGGVWIPPPRDEDPSPVSPAQSDPASDTVSALHAGLADIEEALDVVDSPHSEGLVSMWLTLRSGLGAMENDQHSCQAPCLDLAVGAEPFDPTENSDLALAIAQQAPELVAIYDALGYAQQIQAARSPVGSTQDSRAASAANLRAFADHVAHEGLDADLDPRQSAYEVDLQDIPATQSELLEQALAAWIVVAAHAPEARDQALDYLWNTYQALNPKLPVEAWPGLSQ